MHRWESRILVHVHWFYHWHVFKVNVDSHIVGNVAWKGCNHVVHVHRHINDLPDDNKLPLCIRRLIFMSCSACRFWAQCSQRLSSFMVATHRCFASRLWASLHLGSTIFRACEDDSVGHTHIVKMPAPNAEHMIYTGTVKHLPSGIGCYVQ